MEEQKKEAPTIHKENRAPSNTDQSALDPLMLPIGDIQGETINAHNIVSGVQINIFKGQSSKANSADLMSSASRPANYIPFPRDPSFEARPGEFERLDALFFESSQEVQRPTRIGFIGMLGMGGIGKTQLAVEFAYRCLDQNRFPSGVFWMPATGNTVFDWQRLFAKLAFDTNYLQIDDDISSSENEARRAQHICRYLASHTDALLILDNVEDPTLVMSALPALAGEEVKCSLLYTSRSIFIPSGITPYSVNQLPRETALSLLLKDTRPSLLNEILLGNKSAEANAALEICQSVNCLPLALVHFRGLLARDQTLTLIHFYEVLQQRGVLQLAKTQYGSAPSLSETFRLSWEKVQNKNAQLIFKLASYFPEATPIPIWLLGLAAGLGEQGNILEPLGEACVQLRELSLFEELSGDLIRLHPLIRDFGRGLVVEDSIQRNALLREAGERLLSHCSNLLLLEQRALHQGYWSLLERIRTIRSYVEKIGTEEQIDQIKNLEKWLDRESYLLADERWWPSKIPGLFYQQIMNRSIEDGKQLKIESVFHSTWLRLRSAAGVEDPSLLRIFAGHTDGISNIAVSPDGQYILTGSHDKTAHLWDVASGRILTIFRGHTQAVTDVAFSPNGQQVLTSSHDKTARLWDIASGQVLTIFQGHSDELNRVAFSPNGQQVLTSSRDKTARLWDIASGQVLAVFQHTEAVYEVAFSPDGKHILTGCLLDRRARLWDIASGKVTAIFQCATFIHGLAFSPDGKQILIGSMRRMAQLWDVATQQVLTTFQGHASDVYHIAFSPDGKQVLTGSTDKTARLWDAASGQMLAVFQGHTDFVFGVAFSPDGKHILTGSWDQKARLWDIASKRAFFTSSRKHGDSEADIRFSSGHGMGIDAAFSSDGKYILTGSHDTTARLWDVASGQVLTIFRGHTRPVTNVAISSNGKQVLTGSHDKTARLWDIASGRVLTTFHGHGNSVRSVAFSPNNHQILTGSYDKTARLWDTASGRVLTTFHGHSDIVRSVAFSPDGKQALTGSRDGTARLWDIESGQVLINFQEHANGINSTAFSPNGQWILTGSFDQTALLWDISGRLLVKFQGYTGWVNNAMFAPNGKTVVVCNAHGQVFLWELSQSWQGHLLGMYSAPFEIGAVFWESTTDMIFADTGEPNGAPHFHRLTLMNIS